MSSKNIYDQPASVTVSIVGDVTSLNGATGDITLTGGSGINVVTSGQNISVSATGGSSGVASVTAGTNISVTGTATNPIINNTAPSQSVVSGNAGISVSTASGVSSVSVNAGLAGAIVQIEDAGGNVCKPTGANPGLVFIEGSSNITTSAVGNILFVNNTAPTQNVTAGTGISVATSGGTSTVSNTGVVSVTAGTNVTVTGTAQNPIISAATASGVSAIEIGGGAPLTGVVNLQSGTGINVAFLGGTPNSAVFSNTGVTSINAGTSTITGAVTMGSNGGITLTQVGNNIAVINGYALNNTSQTAAFNGGTSVVNVSLITQQLGPALYAVGTTAEFGITTGSGAVAQFFASVPLAAAVPNTEAFTMLYQDPTLPASSTTLRNGSMVFSPGSGVTNIVLQPDPNSPSGLFPASTTFVFKRMYRLFSTSVVI